MRVRSMTDGILHVVEWEHCVSAHNCWIEVFAFVFGIFIDEMNGVFPVNVREWTKAITENISEGSIQDFEMLLCSAC
jgi:hypothetical protein